MSDELSPFWHRLSCRGNAIALIDADANLAWTYRMLGNRVQEAADRLRAWPRSLVLLFASNDVGSVVLYLAALAAEHVVHLSPVRLQHPSATALIDQYRPDLVIGRFEGPSSTLDRDYGESGVECEYRILARRFRNDSVPHEALALMLSTSASTGSPKSARLSRANLAASAAQVASALGISEHDRALLALPISYVYGLSVLNSALQAGASVALVCGTAADRAYWRSVARSQATIVPAVSQTLEYMRLLRVDARELPCLRGVTHSGDALDPTILQWMIDNLASKGVSLYLMYGQTEACGRITVLPPDRLVQQKGSVGKPVPGGRVAIGADGEIIYRGPGVMLGYATRREDLTLGDSLQGVLRTGDVGRLDAEGFLYITGRLTRYCKIFGHRVSLDEVEAFIRSGCAAAAIEKEGVIFIFLETATSTASVSPAQLARQFHLPPQSFRVERIESMPRTARGKIAYPALLEHALSGGPGS